MVRIAMVALLATAPSLVYAQVDLKEQINVKMVRVSATGGRPAALLELLNAYSKPLDVEVTCTFLKDNKPVTHGFGMVTVPPGQRPQSLEVRSAQPQKFEKATCAVESVKP